MRLRWIVAWVCLVLATRTALGQIDRYEPGRRLRAMERAWDRQTDPAVRADASPQLTKAVRAFFSMNLTDASRAIDEAALHLRSRGKEPTTTERWVAALDFVPETRLVDLGRKTLPVTVKLAYDVQPPVIDRVGVHLSFCGADPTSETDAQAVELETSGLPRTIAVDISEVAPGDTVLHAAVFSGKAFVGRLELGVSVVERLADRLKSAGEALQRLEDAQAAQKTEIATARGLLAQLQALAGGRLLETDVPAARRLEQLEALIESANVGKAYVGPACVGDAWLTYTGEALKSRQVAVRQWVPATIATGTARPLVIALHGAGGSENMFFDAYGDGAIVRLCRKRGWMVVAPRSGMLGAAPISELVDAVASRYPVDRSRVFLVGHSMGAAQAVSAVSREPARFAGVAALGGGGRIGKTPADRLKAVPFFVGVGSDDFLKASALELNTALASAGIEDVEFREYPQIEHLAIVQVALPDVFAFFDRVAKRQASEVD